MAGALGNGSNVATCDYLQYYKYQADGTYGNVAAGVRLRAGPSDSKRCIEGALFVHHVGAWVRKLACCHYAYFAPANQCIESNGTRAPELSMDLVDVVSESGRDLEDLGSLCWQALPRLVTRHPRALLNKHAWLA